jgi:hypothetical protein
VIAADDLMAWLGNPSEPGVATVLEALEARAVEIVESESDRYFGEAIEHVEQLVGDGSDRLYLRERPDAENESVPAITVECRAKPADAWTEISASGWEVELPRPAWLGAVLRRKGDVWEAGYEYRVTYTFGYAAGEEPGDIRQAVIDIVSFLYLERGRQGLRTETIGDYSYSVMADVQGRRNLLSAVPGLESTVRRWKGLVCA